METTYVLDPHQFQGKGGSGSSSGSGSRVLMTNNVKKFTAKGNLFHQIFYFLLFFPRPFSSVADPGCLSPILIFTHPGSRIPDPKTGTKERGCAAHIGMDGIRIEKEPRQETNM
jgi:hypothetical protein